MHYTSSHWGLREVVVDADGTPRLHPFSGDPDPSEIGLDLNEAPLQDLRIRRPAVRKSWLEGGAGARTQARGAEPFVEVDWDRALDLVARELQRVRADHGNEAIFAGSYGWSSAGRFHHAQSQLHRFMNVVGGYVRHLNSYSLGAAHVVMAHLVAPMKQLMADHTSWDVMEDHTRLFVAFGGVPRKNAQVSAGGVRRHLTRGGIDRLAGAGARIVNIGPVRDNLDAERAEWLPIRPNTDTAVMMGIAYVLLREGLHDAAFLERYCVGFDRFARYLTGADTGTPRTPEWAEAVSGMPARRIEQLARDMAAARTMINMSWSLQRASHGEQPCWMLVTLAAMLGQIGLPGGGFGFGYGATNALGSRYPLVAGPVFPQGRNPVEPFIPVARIADMLLNPGALFDYEGGRHAYPDIRLVYWAGGNPYHHHQDLNRLEQAWRKPETIVVHEQYWTPTARRADIVLPATTTLERNDIGFATREGHLVAMRQVVEPLAEARNDFDVFCGLADRLGLRAAFDEGLDELGWLRRMYEDCRATMPDQSVPLPDFDGFWEQGLVELDEAAPVIMLEAFREDPDAAPLSTPSGRIEIFSERIAGFGLDDCPGHAAWFEPHEWLGGAEAGGDWLHLLSDQPARRLHSQLDASAFSRAGKVDGREQMDINPHDAAARGIEEGDVVELSNARGRCLAAARLTEAVMPGVVRLSTGAWFDPDEDGRDKHGNPNVLTLDVGTSRFAQGNIAQSCLVQVRGPINAASPVTAFELPAIEAPDA